MDKLLEQGQQMGLKGPELFKFVTEQQTIEREDRAAEREAEKLKAEVTAEKNADRSRTREEESRSRTGDEGK